MCISFFDCGVSCPRKTRKYMLLNQLNVRIQVQFLKWNVSVTTYMMILAVSRLCSLCPVMPKQCLNTWVYLKLQKFLFSMSAKTGALQRQQDCHQRLQPIVIQWLVEFPFFGSCLFCCSMHWYKDFPLYCQPASIAGAARVIVVIMVTECMQVCHLY